MPQLNSLEDLARYLFHRNEFNSTKELVKYPAFMPPANRRLSMFHISGLGEQEIWEIGERVASQRSLPLLARADIKVSFINKTALIIDEDGTIQRHVNIVGWPDDSTEIRLKAIDLAEMAVLCMNEENRDSDRF